MASSTLTHKCSGSEECKRMGMINCDGCIAFVVAFVLSDQGIFLQTVEKISKEPTESLLKIDLWEKEMLLEIPRVADNERRRIRELMTLMGGLATSQLMNWLQEWERRNEAGDYFEQEVEKLEQRLNQLQTEVIKMTQLQILPMSIDWSNVFHIETDSFLGTSLLSKEHQKKLDEFIGKPRRQWNLIYRATQDGFDSKDFASCCAEQGPTITVISSSSGHLFGGFTNQNWHRHTHEKYNADPTAFIFTLSNPHKISPTKYAISESHISEAIQSDPSCGPIFGASDMAICTGCNSSSGSKIKFPASYVDTTRKGATTFTGTETFTVAEIEVYRRAH